MNQKSKARRATQASRMIAGVRKHLSDGSQALQVGGASYTVDSLTQQLQGIIDRRADVEAAKSTAAAKIDAEDAGGPTTIAFLNALESVIRGMFPSVDALADFGLAARKRSSVAAKDKAVAVAKRAATRQARHTMGPTQKKAVKGSVTATLVVTPMPINSGLGASPPTTSVSAPPATATPVTSGMTGAMGSTAPAAAAPAPSWTTVPPATTGVPSPSTTGATAAGAPALPAQPPIVTLR
jgi:hypothetical protein